MKTTLTGLALTGWLAAAGGAWAQDYWVQVEAQPTLSEAQDRARAYAARLPEVAGFTLSSGWYAVALGPFEQAEAGSVRARLLSSGAIPRDAFIVESSAYGDRFWPAGGVPSAQPAAPAAAAPAPAAESPVEPEPEPEPQETLAEAQAAEAALSREEKQFLQIALQWAGVYEGTIDGLFGRGTRGSMAAWQQARGYETTGVLTTAQRAELIEDYNSVLDGMDIARVVNRQAGIALAMPTGAVEYTELSPPFARYDGTGDVPGAMVLLISQPGNQDTLYGLYEILQSLEIVPEEGERERRADGFTITGQNRDIVSRTEVVLDGDTIKGWMLVWPAGDEERRTRILQNMIPSFEILPGRLDPSAASAGEDQAIDLVSGLEIRQPLRTRSGVFVDAAGRVLTIAEAVAGCGSVTIDGDIPARVSRQTDRLALLEPGISMAPGGTATFQTGVPRIGSEVAIAGFPFGGVIAAPALTFGTLEDIRGLEGEEDIKRIEATISEGDAGGAVIDPTGALLGLLLADSDAGGRQMPEGVHFVYETDAILADLEGTGVSLATATGGATATHEQLTRRAAEFAVSVSCWE
ncbi:trypsin-like peptidase domain-containing protein [Wenxinia saemankumensis]|uniref:Sporulation related domain-containing protein n=1 Tax=Wenxinia saemankumensis TaxID=1447782 RepID=A0A1M6ALV1_9RHOB|nr:peptidoglycan-binding protein [Wenxinia saemankumensis]SHI37435.1 Sporulation related domain-containing protein [Wenxinia saemankumensis]